MRTKDERLRHRLRIEDLAKRTRIRATYLEALEENRFADLPAAAFVKGYIKTYSAIFGFNYQPLLALLRRDYKESAQGTLVPREFIKPLLKKRGQKNSVTMVFLVLTAVFGSLLGYVGVQWYNLNKPPELIIISPKEQELVSGKVVVAGKTVTDAVVTVNDQPVALQADGSFVTELVAQRQGLFFVTVTAQDRRGKSNTAERLVTVSF